MMFSFIVPVYNVKNYLSQCIDSVLGQSYKNYEIILIDDGSTDGSEKICDAYARQNPSQIRVIHQKNQGQSVARNVGIEKARGKYLIMLDSDDYLSNDYFLDSVCPDCFTQDIIVFSYIKVPDGMDKDDLEADDSLKGLQNEYKSGQKYLKSALEKKHLYEWYVWRYFFRREFWNENAFSFREGIKYEDVDLLYRILLKAGSVSIKADHVGYCYRTNRSGSTVYSPNISIYKDMIVVAENNIAEVLARNDLEKELSMALCNNFSCLYYSVILNMGFIKSKGEWDTMVDFLDAHKQICNYTYEKKQLIVRKMIKYMGVRLTSRILGLRTRMKYGIRE